MKSRGASQSFVLTRIFSENRFTLFGTRFLLCLFCEAYEQRHVFQTNLPLIQALLSGD